MTEKSALSELPPQPSQPRLLPLLFVAPLASVVLLAVLTLLFRSALPARIAIHGGPDGVGYGSTALMLAVPCAAAVVVFAISGAMTREFFKDGHWFQTQKFMAVAGMALGYGLLGVVGGTLAGTVGVAAEDVSGGSVGAGMLGFLLAFTVAACVYAVAFPRAKFESLG